MSPSKPEKKNTAKSTDSAPIVSKTVAKPDKLRSSATAVRRRKTRRVAKPARLSIPLFLRKFTEISLIACFIGPVIAYNLAIPPHWQAKLWGFLNNLDPKPVIWGKAFDHNPLNLLIQDLFPFLGGFMPILELKTTIWLMLGLILVAAHLSGRIFEKVSGHRVYAPSLAPPETSRPWIRRIPLICIVGFAVWSLLSFAPWVGWSPPPPSDALLAANQAIDATYNGSLHSLVSWLQVVAAIAFFIVVEDAIRTRRQVYKIIGLIIGMGTFAATISILIQWKLPGLYDIWSKFPPTESRNDVGGIIGHNTAVSSFMMAPMLIAWGILMCHTRKSSKWKLGLLIGSIVLMAITLIMAQSRAVIPILFLGFCALMYLLARKASLRPGLTFWVAVPLVVLLILLSQFISHPNNPFYRRNVPLVQRIQHLTFEHLHTETRLRILVCSMPVVRDHFLRGTGWGSFHFVYPKAQGLYYETHPESTIMPTPKRTFRAHNDYLQTLLEVGVIGLGFALTAVIAILVAGWRTMTQSFRQRHIALQLSILVSIICLLAHGLVDFPYRVAPLAVTLLILLAIWSAGRHLWLIPVPAVSERESGDEASEEDKASAPAAKRLAAPSGRPLPKIVQNTWFVGIFGASMMVVTLVGIYTAQWYSAVLVTNKATLSINQYINGFIEKRTPNAINFLASAQSQMDDGLRLALLNGELNYSNAQLHQLLASEYFSRLNDAKQTGSERDLAIAKDQINNHIKEGQFQLNESLLHYYRFHGSYRLRAMFHMLQYFNTHDGPELKLAMENLDTSVRMNPGDPEAIKIFLEWKLRFDPEDTQRRSELYRTLKHFHPEFFHDEYVNDILIRMAYFDPQKAYENATELYRAMPADPELIRLMANTANVVGDTEMANKAIAKIPASDNPDIQIQRALIAARQGDLDRAVQELSSRNINEPKEFRNYRLMVRRIIDREVARQNNNTEDADKILQTIVQTAEHDPQVYVDSAVQMLQIFGDLETAIALMEKRLAVSSPAPPAADYARYALMLVGRHRQSMNELLELQQKSHQKGLPIPTVKDPAVRQDLEKALDANRQALFNSFTPIEESLLQLRIQELIQILGNKPTNGSVGGNTP